MIATAFTKKTVAPTVETWTRPADWLALPAIPTHPPDHQHRQGLVGLCAVPPEGAYVAFRVSVSVAAASGGRFVVNWGDGTPVEEINENTTVYKTLNYSAYSGTDSARGYRQAIITVTPKSGQNLTVIQLRNHTSQPNASTPWLDLEINGTTALTQVTIGASSVFNRQLERVKIHGLGNVTSLASLFRECNSLAEVILPSTTKITSTAAMFYNCLSLLSVPPMDTTNVADMSNMFFNCYRLKAVPTLNTAKATTMASMFYACIALESVQTSFSTGLCTTFSGMFQSCWKLKAPPIFSDTSKVTIIANMFNGCYELESAPQMNCALVTNASAVFSNCVKLTALPSYVFPKALTDTRWFISGARKLKSITNVTFSSTLGNMQDFASNAWALSGVPALNLSASTNTNLAFNRCSSLASVPAGFAAGAKVNIDFRYCSLSAEALNAIFNSLAAIPSAQTTKPIIYIIGNPGTATCNTALATNKYWVVNKTTA